MVRGQPREDAILKATQEELVSYGYANLTIDGVARRAASSKATIYRRWKDKAALVKACLDALDADDTANVPETGELRGDLLALVTSLTQKANPAYLDMLQDLVLCAKRDPKLRAALREHVQDDEVSPVHAVLARHFKRRDLDFELVHDVLEGMLIGTLQRHAALGLHPEVAPGAAFARRVVDRVLLPIIEAQRARGRR